MIKRALYYTAALLLTACQGDYQYEEDPVYHEDHQEKHNIHYQQRSNDGYSLGSTAEAPALVRVQQLSPESAAVGEDLPVILQVSACENICDVVVCNTIGNCVEVVTTNPPAHLENNTIVWQIDKMDRGECRTLKAVLRAQQVGCLMECITVKATPRLCMSTFIGDCDLSIEKTGPEYVCLGGVAYYTIRVSNRGTLPAKDVCVTEMIPKGMRHASGDKQVEFKLGLLDYNSSETLTICLDAKEKGCMTNRVSVSASNTKTATTEFTTTVVEADLALSIEGTKDQFICKTADYTITVTNTGDTPLCDVIVCDTVAPCTTFRNRSEGCVRDNTISWNAGRLDPGESKCWPISLKNDQPSKCENKVFARGYCQYCGPVESRTAITTNWHGIPEITVEMMDECDPIVCGDTGTYRIRVTNQGSAADENFNIAVHFPDQLIPTNIGGSSKGRISENSVIFETVKQLKPGCSLDYTIEAKSCDAGDARIRVEVHSDSLRNPVVQEENTYIY